MTIMAYFIEYRGAVYHFVGYAPQQAFGAFRSAFLQTMQGFGETQDPRILNRQPVRLALQSVARPAPLRDVVPKTLPAPFKLDEVAILNQLESNQEIPQGRIPKSPPCASRVS